MSVEKISQEREIGEFIIVVTKMNPGFDELESYDMEMKTILNKIERCLNKPPESS